MSLRAAALFRFTVPLFCALTAASAPSQSPLTTTFSGGNQGATNGVVYCDLAPAASGVTVSQIDTHLQAPGAVGRVDVYVMQGASATTGYGNPGSWTLHSRCPVVAGPLGTPSVLVLDPPLSITGSTTCAIALVGFNVGHRFTNSTGTVPQVWSNPELTLTSRGVSNLAFGSGLSTQATRIVNMAVHYAPTSAATVATAASLGQSCGPQSYASLYEWFGYYNGASQFDLANTSITFLPLAGGYAVVASGSLLPVGSLSTPTPLALTADGVANPGSLGLNVAANGFVALNSGNSGSASSSILPNPTAVMNNPATAWYMYHDWDPTLGGTVYYEEAGTQAQVTFAGVFNASYTGVQGPSIFQFQIDTATGTAVLAIGSITVDTAAYLVGYSPGGASKNPGPTDLSSALAGAGAIILGASDLLQPVLHASTRPVMGTNWSARCEEIPPTTGFGLTIYGTGDPGILDLVSLGMPGCQARSSFDIMSDFWFAGPTYNYLVSIPNDPGLAGAAVFTQIATFDTIPVNSFGAISTNGLRLVLNTF